MVSAMGHFQGMHTFSYFKKIHDILSKIVEFVMGSKFCNQYGFCVY